MSSSEHPSPSVAPEAELGAKIAPPHPREFSVDVSDPATFASGFPHEYFRSLREHDPVHWQEERKLPGVPQGPGYWALTRHEDISQVSKDSKTFSSYVGTSVLSEMRPRDLQNMQEQLIHMDPPDHTELRTLINPHFKPSRIRDTEEQTRRIVQEVLDDLAGASTCDFVADVSAPISLRVLTNFLGVPDKHSKKFYKWTNKMIGAGDPGESSVFRARLAVLELFIYARLLARKRRKRPNDDIYSTLVNGRFKDLPLDPLQLGMNFFLLVVAGNETTRNALSGGILALCQHPDQLERLGKEPELLPQAIEEILRWVTPVMQFRRTATRDTHIGEQAIRKGDKVVMYYGAANRDPRIFDDPECFDITRKVNPHLAFGTGTHFCVGSHMARMGMRITLEEFLGRHPSLGLAGPPARLHSNFISGIKRLPLTLG
jgi:cholest-4-en-3-one 26-monooxygenase